MSEAEGVLRALLQVRWAGARCDVTPLSSHGANYTSALYAVQVHEHRPPLDVFAKVAIVGVNMREVMNAENLFKTEYSVYTELAKLYDQIQEKHGVSDQHRFVFPAFYGGTQTLGSETVLLQDMRASGFQDYDRFKSLDWEHAQSAVSALARFHALSFACEHEFPDEYKLALEKFAFVERESKDETVKGAWAKMLGSAIEVVKDPDHKERLVKLLSEGDVAKEFAKFRKPLSRAVLAHGDYRPSNMLFRTKDGAVQTVVVDYQTLHVGCPTADLLYLVLLGTDAAFRQRHHRALLDHYHEELSQALRRLQLDADQLYPRDTFLQEVQQMLRYALLVSVVLLPIVTVEASSAPRIDSDASVEQFALPPSDLFAARFNEVLTDCVAWGAL